MVGLPRGDKGDLAGQNPKIQSWDSGEEFAALGTYLLGITEAAAGWFG
jgi:hypothetical protein